jgi:hypothetical protein
MCRNFFQFDQSNRKLYGEKYAHELWSSFNTQFSPGSSHLPFLRYRNAKPYGSFISKFYPRTLSVSRLYGVDTFHNLSSFFGVKVQVSHSYTYPEVAYHKLKNATLGIGEYTGQ